MLLLAPAVMLSFKKYTSCLNQLKLIITNEVVAAKVLICLKLYNCVHTWLCFAHLKVSERNET